MFPVFVSGFFLVLLQEEFTDKRCDFYTLFFVLFFRLKCPYETAVELAALCLQGMQSFESSLF